jgi:hypothetical protein
MLESDKCVWIIIFSYFDDVLVMRGISARLLNVTTRKRIFEGPYAVLRRHSLYPDNKWLKNH